MWAQSRRSQPAGLRFALAGAELAAMLQRILALWPGLVMQVGAVVRAFARAVSTLPCSE
jgi:hypothetical protein